MVALILLMVAVFFLVLTGRRLVEVNEELSEVKLALESWKDEAVKYRQQTYEWEDEKESFDSMKAENTRLKKAASKLIIQVAESFGREVTKPPK
jgi:hypothetical protein